MNGAFSSGNEPDNITLRRYARFFSAFPGLSLVSLGRKNSISFSAEVFPLRLAMRYSRRFQTCWVLPEFSSSLLLPCPIEKDPNIVMTYSDFNAFSRTCIRSPFPAAEYRQDPI
jgi:hypothetical protein